MIPLKLEDIQYPKVLSKHILTAKSIIINNLKIQMLAGNSLKMCVGFSFDISSTLVPTSSSNFLRLEAILKLS